jgi:hypothetical protein
MVADEDLVDDNRTIVVTAGNTPEDAKIPMALLLGSRKGHS